MSSARRFAREIEARWGALLQRPVVLGERDWQTICDWHARRIPLELIGEAMEQFGDKLARRRHKPRNLGALAPLVEEAWRTVVEGRLEPGERAPEQSGDETAANVWRARAAALPGNDPLRRLLGDLLRKLGDGAPPEAIDAALDAGLPACTETALLEELRTEIESSLGPFRERMSPAAWNATRDRALISSIRRRLRLPRLGR